MQRATHDLWEHAIRVMHERCEMSDVGMRHSPTWDIQFDILVTCHHITFCIGCSLLKEQSRYKNWIHTAVTNPPLKDTALTPSTTHLFQGRTSPFLKRNLSFIAVLLCCSINNNHGWSTHTKSSVTCIYFRLNYRKHLGDDVSAEVFSPYIKTVQKSVKC